MAAKRTQSSAKARPAAAVARVRASIVKGNACRSHADRCTNKRGIIGTRVGTSGEHQTDISDPNVSGQAARFAELLEPVREGLPVDGLAKQLALLRGVAHGLMNHWELWIAGRRHRIVEMEAYVHGFDHKDPYVHCDDGQRHGGCWYFHKQGNSFKGGSFKGLDLACGGGGGRGSGPDGSVRGGLLLRSVMEVPESGGKGGELIEGPCLVVDRILRLCEQPSIAAFVAGRSTAELGALSTKGLSLKLAPFAWSDHVWEAPRVGLVLREDESKTHSSGRPVDFVGRPYRFSVLPCRLGKFRAGFVAAAHVAARGGVDKSSVAVDFRKGLGLSRSDDYVAATEKGMREGCPDRFINRKIATQQDLCELYGACSTMVSIAAC
eukprot:TRINITY_DN76261_c0_g1_i1.p1 TRINITY_DN76261_c0_g1~~TRINITY_DN76261_c0_g1_i1.p1  ORF type:complete len:397 (+),score=43.29 TRINITY_DN76261_c0_g1_i1:56-1192(+)